MPRLSAVNPLVHEAAHIRPERRAQGIEDALKQNPLPVGEALPKGAPDAQGDELHGPVKRNGEATFPHPASLLPSEMLPVHYISACKHLSTLC